MTESPNTGNRWEVTLLDRGYEITVRVSSGTKEGARREARKLHPRGHIVHVEKSEHQLSECKGGHDSGEMLWPLTAHQGVICRRCGVFLPC